MAGGVIVSPATCEWQEGWKNKCWTEA